MGDGVADAASSLRVGVMGAGAIGCYVGGLLGTTGLDVVLVGRARGKAEFDAAGLTVSDLGGRVAQVDRARVTFATDVKALVGTSVVLCCVKSAGTREAGRELASVLPEDALVVSLQNGIRNADDLRSGLLARTVLGGIVSFNVVAREGGIFRQTTTGPLLIERSSDPRAVALVQALAKAGLEAAFAPDIRASQWTKLIINLSNAVSALSDVPTSQLLLSPGYRRCMALLMREALAALRRAGIRPGKLGPLPVSLFPTMLALPTPLLRLAARVQLEVDPEARASMWEDLTRRRPTEVDALNGEIVRLAARSGGTAPANERVVEAIHRAEKAAKGSPRLSAGELWATLTTAAPTS